MRVYTGRDLHVFAFHQGPGRFRRRRGTFPAHGVTVRWRDPRGTGRWRTWRVRLHLMGATEDGRGLVHFEADTWLTRRGTGKRVVDRLGGKSFVRVRAGRGRPAA